MTTAHSQPASPGLLSANLICMASMLIWAAGLPAGDLLIPLMAPEQLTALRMALAAAAVTGFWAATEGLAPLARINWPKGVAVGSLIGLGAWFLILGQARGGAVTAAVISATLPVVGIALEVLFDGRRVAAPLVMGLVLSLIGGIVALDLAAAGASMGWGALLCFASVVTFAVGSRLTVTAFPGQTPVGRTAVTLTGAAVASLAVALAGGFAGAAPPDFSNWGAAEAGALLLYAVGALGVSQVLFIMSVERLGIGLSAMHINLAPFYVMLIRLGLGYPWSWAQAGGAALVGFGVLIAQGVIPIGRKP